MATPEELESLKAEYETRIEAIDAKNRELLAINSKLKKANNEVDIEAHHKLIDRVDALEGENTKLQNEVKLKAKDLEKVTGDLTKKDAFLSKTILTDGLGKALLEAGVDAKFLPAAQAMLEKQAKVVQNGDDYSAMIGDVSANDFVKSWVADAGKIFTMVQPDTGAGARGGSGSGSADSKRYFDKASPDFSLTEQARILQTDPTLYASLKG